MRAAGDYARRDLQRIAQSVARAEANSVAGILAHKRKRGIVSRLVSFFCEVL